MPETKGQLSDSPRVRVTVECSVCGGSGGSFGVECHHCMGGTILATPTPETAALLADGEALRAENARLLAAINWACGCGTSDFGDNMHDSPNRYWWRKGLTERAGLTYNADASRYLPTPRPSPDTEGGNG